MSALSVTSDPYETLQVQPCAEPEVIRAAHRALAAKWHPDRGATPERMIAINAAWRVLGDPGRRADFDLGPAVTSATTTVGHSPAGGGGKPARSLRESRTADSLLDFGRYAGLTVSQLVDQDSDYAVWLARTPIGRRLAPEIDAALVRRETQLAGLAPQPPVARQGFLRRRRVEAR
jgi:curved DNA-binding protein CbpA